MGNEVLFWSQIGSVIVYVITLFTVYRVLVASKDATIQEKDATIENLRTHLEEAKGRTPDILLSQLRERTIALTEEIKRLEKQESKNKEKITELETERDVLDAIMLRSNKISIISELLERSRYETYKEFVTSICGTAANASRGISEFESLEELIAQSGRQLERVDDRTKLVLDIEKKEPSFMQGTCVADGIWVVYTREVKVEVKLWEILRSLHGAIRSEAEEISENREKGIGEMPRSKFTDHG